MRAAWCSSRNHAAQIQDEQLLSCTIRNTEHRPSCQVALRYKPPVNVKVIRVYRTTLNANSALIMTGTSSQTTKRENYHHVLPSFWERVSHTSWWYDVLHKTTQCNNKTNDCSATHTRQLNKMPPCKPSTRRKRLASVKANGVYHKTTLCKYRNDRRRHLFANNVNQTRVGVSSRNPGGKVFITRKHTVPNVAVFNTRTMTGSVTKTHVDGFHHANHHLSKKASQILVVWCSSQKTYSTNVARIITGTSICAPTRLDNIP